MKHRPSSAFAKNSFVRFRSRLCGEKSTTFFQDSALFHVKQSFSSKLLCLKKKSGEFKKNRAFFSIFLPRQSIFISKNNKIAQFDGSLGKSATGLTKTREIRRETEEPVRVRGQEYRKVADRAQNWMRRRSFAAIGANRVLGCYTNDALCGKSVENVLKRGGELVFFSKNSS